jgi:hypothetical protein
MGYWVKVREYGTTKVDILALASDDSLFFGQHVQKLLDSLTG